MRCWPLLLTTCLLAASPALAEIYRWVDENGVVHFSDRPGVEGAERVTGPRAPAQSAAPAAAPNPAPPPEDDADAPLEVYVEDEAAAANREANCRVSQERLEMLERAPRLFQLGADGERQYLDDDQVAESLALASAQVTHWCE